MGRECAKVLLWVAAMALVTLFLLTWPADATDCPPGTTATPFGSPSKGVHLTQPNLPAYYVVLHAPDGQSWWYPFGAYWVDVEGQWVVCYTENVHDWLAANGVTTTTRATPEAPATTTTTVVPATPVVPRKRVAPEPERRYGVWEAYRQVTWCVWAL